MTHWMIVRHFLGAGIGICVEAILAASLTSGSAAAKDDDWIWCQARSEGNRSSQITIYYSKAFLGDYSSKVRYENAFGDYVESRHGDINLGQTRCFFEDTRSAARAERDDLATDYRRSNYRAIVFTDWEY